MAGTVCCARMTRSRSGRPAALLALGFRTASGRTGRTTPVRAPVVAGLCGWSARISYDRAFGYGLR
ncbi:hypothetical protein [Streptomyces sp. NPDC005283]|uniref:hypothetical protein n=1 Tax=Streptomyces sp. NPDC005283 TaxID=3156871 RepID=UPI0034528BF1